MNYVKMMLDRGICLTNMSDYDFAILEYAMEQEKQRRQQEQQERLRRDFSDQLQDLAANIMDHDFVICYDCETIEPCRLTLRPKDD